MRMKLLGVTIIVALLVSLVGIRQASAADTAPFVSISIADGYVGDYEEYHISFLLGRDVKPQETLSVVFDDVINCAGLRDTAAGDVLIDGMPVGASALWSGHILTVSTPMNLSAGITHELTILRGAMIQNPSTAMHFHLLLRDDTAGTTLASNYVGVSTVTSISPVSLTVETFGHHLTVLLRFCTGRTGALVWAPAQRTASSSAVASDTISFRLSPALSQVWDKSGAPVAWFSISVPGATRAPRLFHLVSTSNWPLEQPGTYQKEVTYELETDTDMVDTGVAASTEVLVRLEFDQSTIPVPLTTDDFALVWTSKEPTMVRIPLTGVPEPVPVAVDDNPAPLPDTTAPVVTWSVQQSTFSSRLITLNISIAEDNLDEAYFVRDGVDSPHTRLAVGNTGLLMVNRTGIKGMIVAVDKSGNTISVPVVIPAPATS